MHFFRFGQLSLKSCAIRLFVIAFAIKLALLGFLIGRNYDNWTAGFQTRDYDDVGYCSSAYELLIYHAFVNPNTNESKQSVYRTSGYIFILSIFEAVTGEDPLFMLIFQALVFRAQH